ncbi:hypothetical protein [Flavobacterium algicola]|uniref:hypothetical protein n=1 Tax=Flavobacterium algicola TaxID=556529 RepID=UPI001EFD0EB6|nr:hypothetical protein [Flavobacterium algicola]MCG9793217.1 hypothetical protein [Flavobacterium algicola]
MDNQDKLFNQIKQAAHQAEDQPFTGMDKVWARVDEKLDQEALATKTKVWKKVAIAASVLLVVSLGYQLTKTKIAVPEIQKTVVVQEATTTEPTDQKIVTSPLLDTLKIKKAIEEQTQIATATTIQKTKAVAVQEPKNELSDKAIEHEKAILARQSQAKSSSRFNRGTIYEAKVVESAYETQAAPAAVAEVQKAPTSAPLVVMNGDLVSSKKYKSVKDAKEAIADIYENELESLVVLDEPLYIINGVEYSEESLFGQHPTSPYAPLSKQKIESLTVLQNEKAIEKYGEKGKKGVVIISTKNGKPLPK